MIPEEEEIEIKMVRKKSTESQLK